MQTIIIFLNNIPVEWRIAAVAWGAGWLFTTTLPISSTGVRLLIGTLIYMVLYLLLLVQERRLNPKEPASQGPTATGESHE